MLLLFSMEINIKLCVRDVIIGAQKRVRSTASVLDVCGLKDKIKVAPSA